MQTIITGTAMMQLRAQQATPIELNASWQQQLASAYTDPAQLGQALQLEPEWIQQHAPARRLFAMRVPRHFVSLMQPGNPNDPLLRQVWPLADEFIATDGFSHDPLGETDATAASGILHKYESRLLLILRGGCAVNCRYCFRRHFPYAEHKIGKRELERVQTYITQHPAVNEVILSGGDPLMANDEQLEHVLSMLEQLPQLRRVRIHSRLPVVIPQRLTATLGRRLARSRLQALLVIHANHGNEISPALTQRLANWRQMGVHLLNQSVLLKGVNDDAGVLAELSEKLFASEVMPYYLHQLDKVAGAAHFAVSDANANLIMHDLLRTLPGFLVPKLVREIAGEASKTPLHF